MLFANVHRRHLTKGQQAMAVALAYPEAAKLKRKDTGSLIIKEQGLNPGYISQARFVLRHCLEKAEEVLSNPHYPPALDESKTTRVSYLPLTADALRACG